MSLVNQTIEPSREQKEAVDRILGNDGPFFVTGKAGSGKSVLALELGKRASVKYCAYTGLAAQNVGGCTIHSLLGMTPHSAPDFDKLYNNIDGHDILVVDEVSMVDSIMTEILLDCLDAIEFSGKVVMVGDFLQLSPIDGEMAFTCERWKELEVIYLVEQYRHSAEFSGILDDIRRGDLSDESQDLIKRRTFDNLPDDCTNLMSKRSDVSQKNNDRLKDLPGKPIRFDHVINYSRSKDMGRARQLIERSGRFPVKLDLKIGARVVMLKNDRLYVNGTTGTVVDINVGNYVRVESDEGYVFNVYKAEEEITGGDGRTLASHRQLPMQLAWALTIHKSQGMTLDKVGISLKSHFANGMTYVAMSRVRSEPGLFLAGKIFNIKVDGIALRYMNNLESNRSSRYR